MITNMGNERMRVSPSDWRWGASIVGLTKYFKFHKISYEQTNDYIEFNELDISREKYLQFVEHFFEEKMHHRTIEELLKKDDLSEEDIKLINEKISGNSIMRRVMGNIKYKGNKNTIIQLIMENRSTIVEHTFREGKALYANFCNKGNLFEHRGSTCRLQGYYVDKGRKLQALSFGIDKKTFVYQDSFFFDFIPFGFSKTRESFFINNNFTIEQLIQTNTTEAWTNEDTKLSSLFYNSNNTPLIIDYEVEIIKKVRENDYYETLYMRQTAINIFQNFGNKQLEILKRPCNIKKAKAAKDIWIDIEKIVTDSILNNIKLDNMIESLFASYYNYYFLISLLIRINQFIYEENNIKSIHKNAFEVAEAVRNALVNKSKKIKYYDQKLIGALTLKDYEKVKEILLHLSACSQVRMDFLIYVYEDFEKNKNLVYTFLNTLEKYNYIALDEGEEI